MPTSASWPCSTSSKKRSLTANRPSSTTAYSRNSTWQSASICGRSAIFAPCPSVVSSCSSAESSWRSAGCARQLRSRSSASSRISIPSERNSAIMLGSRASPASLCWRAPASTNLAWCSACTFARNSGAPSMGASGSWSRLARPRRNSISASCSSSASARSI